jgi:LacI family transcriptional regulator
MLVPSIDYPIFPMIILGVEKVMHDHNYEVLVYNTEVGPERTRKGLELLAENQVDGVMVFTNRIANDELETLLSRQRAVVLVNIVLPGSHAKVVRIDVVRGIELLVQHLLEAGRRRIALLTYPKSNYSATERLRGYQQAMAKFGLPVDDNLIIVCDDSQAAVFDRVQQVITNGPPVDAFICYNDLMAATTLKACFDLGIAIPDQIAVTGFDNIPFTELFKCPLTTVSIDWFEMGVAAAQMILDHINGDDAVSEIIFKPELVVRESTP